MATIWVEWSTTQPSFHGWTLQDGQRKANNTARSPPRAVARDIRPLVPCRYCLSRVMQPPIVAFLGICMWRPPKEPHWGAWGWATGRSFDTVFSWLATVLSLWRLLTTSSLAQSGSTRSQIQSSSLRRLPRSQRLSPQNSLFTLSITRATHITSSILSIFNLSCEGFTTELNLESPFSPWSIQRWESIVSQVKRWSPRNHTTKRAFSVVIWQLSCLLTLESARTLRVFTYEPKSLR